jgi:hypothetical protein
VTGILYFVLCIDGHRGYEVIIPNMPIIVASKELINEVDEV